MDTKPGALFRGRALAVWVWVGVSVGLGLSVAAVYSHRASEPGVKDIQLDWLSAKAGIHGDAYASMSDLAEQFEISIDLPVPRGASSAIHPRTPGAILLQLPLLAVGFDRLVFLGTAVSIACLTLLVMFGTQGHGLPRTLVGGVFTAISIPALTAIQYTTQSVLVGAAVLLGWTLISSGREKFGGSILGAAAVLKVFPAILIVPLLFGRRFAAAASVAVTIAILTLGGLLLPGVSANGAIAALTQAGDVWSGYLANAGLSLVVNSFGLPKPTTLLLITSMAAVLTALVVRCGDRARVDPLPWILIGLLILPLSWAHYDVVLIPSVLALLLAPRPGTPWRSILVPCLWLLPTSLLIVGTVYPGPWFLSARLLLLAVWLTGTLDWNSRFGNGGWIAIPKVRYHPT